MRGGEAVSGMRVGHCMLAAALLLAPAAVSADIYKCTSGGQLKYQQEPCAAGERQERTAQAPAPRPPAASIGQAGGPQLDEGSEEAYQAFQIKRVCDRVPGFSEQSAAAYAALEFAHANALAQMRREQQNRPGQEYGPLPQVSQQDLRTLCMDHVLPALKDLARPPNPIYATPQATWNALLAALRRGDRDGALAVFSESGFKDGLRRMFTSMSDGQLADMADSFGGFSIGQSYGEFTEAYVARSNGRAGIVTFVRINREWKIESM